MFNANVSSIEQYKYKDFLERLWQSRRSRNKVHPLLHTHITEAEERQAARIAEAKQKAEGGGKSGPPRRMKIVRAGPATHDYQNPNAKFFIVSELEERHLLHSEQYFGEVVAFPENVVGRLASLGMFNEKQGFHLMRQPVSVIRNNSGLVARELFAQDIRHLGTDKRRVLVTGKGGSGKSFILLQMAAMALMQKYVVVAVPRGISVFLELG
jgi:Mitochondrial ribosomal death-associated protein 3